MRVRKNKLNVGRITLGFFQIEAKRGTRKEKQKNDGSYIRKGRVLLGLRRVKEGIGKKQSNGVSQRVCHVFPTFDSNEDTSICLR